MFVEFNFPFSPLYPEHGKPLFFDQEVYAAQLREFANSDSQFHALLPEDWPNRKSKPRFWERIICWSSKFVPFI